MSDIQWAERPALPVPAHITQATAVEQARALGEVHAAVQVAQERPRDMARAIAEMRDSCNRVALAERAFYAVPNRGSGKSVHLARELARIWGNIDHGVHELRRDDEAGMSEIRAFAWDQQANVRSTRTFQVPHQRMKTIKGKATREDLYDLGDVYRNNQNIGARAVRECIFSVLPGWFTDEAEQLCRATLQKGEDGVALPERIDNMIKAFRGVGVTVDQLERRIGRKRGQWTADDAAQMGIVYGSIQRNELRVEDEFPQRVTADEITGGTAAAVEPPDPAYDDEKWLAGKDKPKDGTD